MKKLLTKTLMVSVLVLLVPFLLTMLFRISHKANTLEAMDFTIYYEANGSKELLSFDEYLLGVVAANMPAGYHMEALKAQAVIARTYALYNITLLSNKNSGRKSFTTSELGLSYIDLDALKLYWSTSDYNNYFTKLENAVYGTKGEVLVYDNALILPVFFDTGYGYTRNASEAWGLDIPYLVSVPSNQDVTSTNYLKIVEYSLSELIALLEKYYTDISLTEDRLFEELTVAKRDSTDYVITMNLGTLSVNGEEFAKVLGLPSSHYYMEAYEGKVRFICNGAGHGVGLSQYGANAMAETGSDYKEILKHYYTGVSFSGLSGDR